MRRDLERSLYREFHYGKPCFRVFHPDGTCHHWTRGTGDYEGVYLGGYLDKMPEYTRGQHLYELRKARR